MSDNVTKQPRMHGEPEMALASSDMEAVKRLHNPAFRKSRPSLARVIVGQDKVIEELLIALFSPGPLYPGKACTGLAKTLMISTLAKTLSLAFSRIQFTPDLMPSDTSPAQK